MILCHNNRPIKLIPDEYKVIENITDYLEDEHHRRLTNTERFNLNRALFIQHANRFVSRLASANKPVFEQIKQATPVSGIIIRNGHGDTQYALRMSNGLNVICPRELFHLAPEKETYTYASALPTISITNNEATQLTLF